MKTGISRWRRVFVGARRTFLGSRAVRGAAAVGLAVLMIGGASSEQTARAPATTGASEMGTPAVWSRYRFGLLRRGPAWTPLRTPATDSIQAGHMANIQRMAEEGVLLGAGPFLDRGELRGVFIFRPDSLERLTALAGRDPAIRSGRLVLDLHDWSAPAGIGAPYAERSRRPGFQDSMITLRLGLLRHTPRWNRADPRERAMMHRAHLERVEELLRSGPLVTAGLFSGPDSLAGVLVFAADSATALRLAGQDPAVRAGLLTVRLHPWMCAYGVMPGDTLR